MNKSMIVLIVTIPTLVWGDSSGAPPESCATMMPQHAAPGETVSCPFSTVPTQMTISWKQQVSVTLRSDQAEKFKGFLTIAFDENNQTIGTFDDVIQPVAKPITCLGLTDIAATHTDATDKDFVNLVWSPPVGFTGYVLFRTTFVMDAYKSWDAIPATNLIQVIEPSTTSMPTTTSSQSTTPTPFICPGDGFYAVPGLCVNYYYLCIGGNTMLRCSGDLLYDPFYLSCQSPDKVTCLATESPTSPADLSTSSMSTSSTEMTTETTTDVPATSTESQSSHSSIVTSSAADSSTASTDSYTNEETTLSTPEVTTNPTDSTTVPSPSTEDQPTQTTSFESISTTSNVNYRTTEDSTTSATVITTSSSSTNATPTTSLTTSTMSPTSTVPTKSTTNATPTTSLRTSTTSSTSTETTKSTTSSANALISASKCVTLLALLLFHEINKSAL